MNTRSYECTEYINTNNLDRILKAKVVRRDHLYKLERLKKALKKGNSHQIMFVQNEKGFGRLKPKKQPGGFEMQTLLPLSRKIRAALVHGLDIQDIDIKNAQPVLYAQVLNQNNIECPVLIDYIENRDKILEDTTKPRDVVKNTYISFMFGGKLPDDATPHMQRFYAECRDTMKSLLRLPKYKTYVPTEEERVGINNPLNPTGHAIAMITQQAETECCLTGIASMRQQGFETSTYQYDGFFVKAKESVEQTHLKKAANDVKTQTGYDVEWVVKPLPNIDEHALWGESHTQMAKQFIAYLEDKGHKFIKHEGSYYWFNPKYGVYKDDLSELREYVDTCPVLSETLRGDTCFQDKILNKQIKSIIPEDPSFEKTALQSTYQRIPFKNGVFNCLTKQLEPYDASVIFFERGSINYNPHQSELEREVRQKLFVDVFGDDIADYVIKVFARALAGESEDKSIFFIIGEGNSGKGTCSNALGKAFRSVFGNLNAGEFTSKGGQDTAKALATLVHNRWNRIGIINECDRDVEWSCATIKTFSGGSDDITARLLHKNQITFQFFCTFFCFMNDLPNIKSPDDQLENRAVVLPTKWSYLEGDLYEQQKHKPYVKKADSTLKRVWLKRDDVIEAFASLIVNAYGAEIPKKPQRVIEETQKHFADGNQDRVLETLIVEVDGYDGMNEEEQSKNNLQFSELKDACEKKGMNLSPQRLRTLMARLGHPNNSKDKIKFFGWYGKNGIMQYKWKNGYKGIEFADALN